MANPNYARQGEKTRQRMYKFIVRYSNKHGYAPTYREIGEAVGIASTNQIRSHMDRLQAAGLIRFTPRVPRSIVVLEQVS